MHLLQMSPELLIHIFDLIGSQAFREDLRLLTISKLWYELALPALHRDLCFSPESLTELLNIKHLENVITIIQRHAVTVELAVAGFEDWLLIPSVAFNPADDWTLRLNFIIARLAVVLQSCTRLRQLRLEARREYHSPILRLSERAYLQTSPLTSLLSLRQLTCLDFDMGGTYTMDQSFEEGGHLCLAINQLFPTLRRLRCRMCSVCDVLLKPPSGDAPLCLKEIVINLSLSETAGADTSYRYPTSCQPPPGGSFARLKDSMEHQARELVPRLTGPKMVRVLSHTFPQLDLFAYDALTNRRMQLLPEAAWDEDGELEEEDDSWESNAETDLFENDSVVSQEMTL